MRIRQIVIIMFLMGLCVNGLTGAEKIKKEKLQVFIMLGQSNMVGLADIRTFQYLLQDPYTPVFDEVKEVLGHGRSPLYYAKIFGTKHGKELYEKMWMDPKYFSMHPRELTSLVRRTIIETLPEDQAPAERDLYDDMIGRLEGRMALRKQMAERFLPGTTEADFEKLGPLAKEVRNLPEVKADRRTERLAYARAVEKAIHLPIAKRTHIYAYGALSSPTGESRIHKEANGPLSIGYGSGYTTIGPEYGFGFAMEEMLDAPILIIKCAWGNTALAEAWRPPSAPPGTNSELRKAREEAFNKVKAERARAEGKEFTPSKPYHAPSPGWCWTHNKFDERIKAVLADLGTYHPKYDPAVGHEVAGMIWFQGHSDGGRGKEYKEMLKYFIHDLRKVTNAPEMRVVIGTVSTTGYKAMYDTSDVVQSQFAVAELPEFKGTVTTVDTLPFYPTELSLLGSMMKTARQSGTEWKTSEQYAEWAKVKGISNAGYHYMGSAECFVEMSIAFAKAMIEMMK